MYRPEELTEGRMLSVPTRAPLGSVDTSCVDGTHAAAAAPTQVSCRKTWRPVEVLATRLVAAELNAMKRPSELIEGAWLSSFPALPSVPAERSAVCCWQEE